MNKIHTWFTPDELCTLASDYTGGNLSVHTIEEAYKFCQEQASRHYENFPVASLLIPASLRKHIYCIYLFSRVADDIADEISILHGKEKAQDILDMMHHTMHLCQQGTFTGNNPLWLAFQNTMNECQLPIQVFERLLQAFSRDITFHQPRTIEDLYDYCYYSANPIGELLLRLYGYWNDEVAVYSDSLCTALQLLNFVQDISIDKQKGRNYIPLSLYPAGHEDQYDLFSRENTLNFSRALHVLFLEIEKLFNSGSMLIPSIPSRRLRLELSLILEGGKTMLHLCKQSQYELFNHKPVLSKSDWFMINAKVINALPRILFHTA